MFNSQLWHRGFIEFYELQRIISSNLCSLYDLQKTFSDKTDLVPHRGICEQHKNFGHWGLPLFPETGKCNVTHGISSEKTSPGEVVLVISATMSELPRLVPP